MVLQNAWVSTWGRLWDKPLGCRLLVSEHGAHGGHDSQFQGRSGPLGRPHGNKALVEVHNCLEHDDMDAAPLLNKLQHQADQQGIEIARGEEH